MRPLPPRVLPLAWMAVIGPALALAPDPALAQSTAGGVLDEAVGSMETVLTQAGDTLGFWARQLLLGLLLLELVWRGGRWALSGQSVADVAEPMLYTIGIASLAWGFTSVVPEVVDWITRTAVTLANGAQPGAGSSLSPSGMMGDGIGRAVGWLDGITLRPVTWVYLVCALVSVLVLAVELAMVVVIYAEIYLVGLVGIATLGFAGLSQTRGVATRYVMSMVGKGFKLLTLLLLVDAAERLARAATDGDVTFEGALGAILLQVVGLVLVITLPGAVERLVAGSAVGDTAGAAGKTVAGAASSGVSTAAGTAAGGLGGAAAGAAAGARAASGKGALAVAKSAGIGALQGGWNWGGAGAHGRIASELSARLGSRVNSIGRGAGER